MVFVDPVTTEREYAHGLCTSIVGFHHHADVVQCVRKLSHGEFTIDDRKSEIVDDVGYYVESSKRSYPCECRQLLHVAAIESSFQLHRGNATSLDWFFSTLESLGSPSESAIRFSSFDI